jgi:hypothetical protein
MEVMGHRVTFALPTPPALLFHSTALLFYSPALVLPCTALPCTVVLSHRNKKLLPRWIGIRVRALL